MRHALSTRQRAKVTSAREQPLLWNLMWPIAGAPHGSFYFDNQSNMLDQLLDNKNMAIGDVPIKVDLDTVQILKLPAMVNPGVYPKATHLAECASRSIKRIPDHFPIAVTITEVDEIDRRNGWALLAGSLPPARHLTGGLAAMGQGTDLRQHA